MLRKTFIVGATLLLACGGNRTPDAGVTPLSCAEAPLAQAPIAAGLGAMCEQSDPVERGVGYAAMAAGVVALIILFIGFYKLGKLLGS